MQGGILKRNPDEAELATNSPRTHYALTVEALDVIRAFGTRGAPGARVLYLGDTDHKSKHVDQARLAAIGVPVTKHDKLPDLVVHDETRAWLFLIEAVTTHGPVSAKRHLELEAVLDASTVGRVYVSAFPSFREFKKYASEIAWETEVWIAEAPDHLLHFNGDRFMGPRTS